MADQIRNDTPYATDEVVALLKEGGVELSYGDLRMMVMPEMLADARDAVKAMPADRRVDAMASVDRALRASLPKVRKMTASKKRMDNFYQDLLIWTALKELGQ